MTSQQLLHDLQRRLHTGIDADTVTMLVYSDGEDLELPTFQDRIVAEIAAIVEGRIAAEGAEQTRRRRTGA